MAAKNWLAQININEEVHTTVTDVEVVRSVRLDEAVVPSVLCGPIERVPSLIASLLLAYQSRYVGSRYFECLKKVDCDTFFIRLQCSGQSQKYCLFWLRESSGKDIRIGQY